MEEGDEGDEEEEEDDEIGKAGQVEVGKPVVIAPEVVLIESDEEEEKDEQYEERGGTQFWLCLPSLLSNSTSFFRNWACSCVNLLERRAQI